MADAAIKNAMKRHNEIGDQIADLRRRIDALRAEQERIGKFIEAWHEFAGAEPSQNIVPERESETLDIVRRETSKRATGNPKKERVAEVAREIIRDRGEPVSRSDMFIELKKRGIELKGADPEMVLSTMLWRMQERVARLKGGGYWLAEEAYPDAGYEPGVDHTGFDSLLNKPVDEAREPHPDDIELLDRIANDIEDDDQ